MRRALRAATALVTLAAPALVGAQPVDGRWAPWMGCWEIVDDTAGAPPDVQSVADFRDATRRRAAPDGVVCVTPSESGEGVTLTTYLADKPVLTQTLVADGRERPVAEGACRGAQQADWSRSGYRVFTRARLSCDREPSRSVDGVSILGVGPEWLDVQMVDVGGHRSIRVRRYQWARDQRHAGGVAMAHDRIPVTSAFSVEDVKEAAGRLPVEVVQAALVETRLGFAVRRRILEDLDEAGVPDAVTDLLVALAFPDRFVVERPNASGATSGWLPGGIQPDDDPTLFGYYYSPFSYWSSRGYYDSTPYPFYGWTRLDPDRGGSGGEPRPSGLGRVVDGHGYTRVRTRDPDPAIRTSDGSTSGTTSAGGSSSGTASPGGYSGGSSGSSSGSDRTAVPRPPGGGR
ncbi:MAG: hypothetical protein AB1635_04460 [Acidobacteriota bacterium]